MNIVKIKPLEIKEVVFYETWMPPVATKSKIATSRFKVIDLGVIWKGFISWVCIPKMRFPSLTVQKLWPRLKFIATDIHTYRQKKRYPWIVFWGHKKTFTIPLFLSVPAASDMGGQALIPETDGVLSPLSSPPGGAASGAYWTSGSVNICTFNLMWSSFINDIFLLLW